MLVVSLKDACVPVSFVDHLILISHDVGVGSNFCDIYFGYRGGIHIDAKWSLQELVENFGVSKFIVR